MATGWYVVEPPTTGLLDAVKGNPARALMVGQNTYSGSLTASIKAALANFQGGQFVSGVASMLADPASASMNGIFFNSANLAATTQKAKAAMVGTSQNRATLASIITKAKAALNGSQTAIGIIAASAATAVGAFGKTLSSNYAANNGGFENGQVLPWSGFSSGSVVDTTTAHSGSNSGRITIPADNSNVSMTYRVGVSLSQGDYLVGFWSKGDTAGTRFALQIGYTPAGGGTKVYYDPSQNPVWAAGNGNAVQAPTVVANMDWTYSEVSIPVPELTDANGITITFKRSGGSIGEAYSGWIDELSVRQYLDANSALGNMNLTLADATAALAGQQISAGVLDGMLKPIGSAMAGYQNPQGSIAATAAKASAQANGGQDIPATFAAALKAAQAAFTSEQSQAGTSDMGMKAASFGGISARTVNVNSVSAFSGQVNGGTFTAAITVQPGEFRRAYAVMAVSHSNWIDSWNFQAWAPGPTNFTVIGGPRGLGDVSGHRQGAVAILELIDIPVGAQTISMRVDATQGINYVHGQVIVFNNVGGRTTPIIVSNPPTGTAMSLTLPAATPNQMHFIANLMNNSTTTLTGAWPAAPGLWLASVQNATGDGDVLHSAYLQGDGADKTFGTSNNPRYATIGLNLINA